MCKRSHAVSGGANDAVIASVVAGDHSALLRAGGVRDVSGQGEGMQEQEGESIPSLFRTVLSLAILPARCAIFRSGTSPFFFLFFVHRFGRFVYNNHALLPPLMLGYTLFDLPEKTKVYLHLANRS